MDSINILILIMLGGFIFNGVFYGAVAPWLHEKQHGKDTSNEEAVWFAKLKIGLITASFIPWFCVFLFLGMVLRRWYRDLRDSWRTIYPKE